MEVVIIILIGAILGLTIQLTRRMCNGTARAAVVIGVTLIGGVVSFVFVALATFSFDEPEMKKRIDDDYYFTHQQYGGATVSTDGQQLVFYKEKAWWPDEKIGKVNCVYCSEYTEARFMPRNGDSAALVLIDRQANLWDTTIVNVKTGFDFSVHALE